MAYSEKEVLLIVAISKYKRQKMEETAQDSVLKKCVFISQSWIYLFARLLYLKITGP